MLRVKRFSTVRDTQRGSQSYMEKRTGRRETEVTRRGGIKRIESNLANKQFPFVLSTVWNPQRSSGSYIEKIRGRKKIEVSRRRKEGAKRIEIDLGSTLFPKFSPQPGTHRGIHGVG